MENLRKGKGAFLAFVSRQQTSPRSALGEAGINCHLIEGSHWLGTFWVFPDRKEKRPGDPLLVDQLHMFSGFGSQDYHKCSF